VTPGAGGTRVLRHSSPPAPEARRFPIPRRWSPLVSEQKPTLHVSAGSNPENASPAICMGWTESRLAAGEPPGR